MVVSLNRNNNRALKVPDAVREDWQRTPYARMRLLIHGALCLSRALDEGFRYG